jgi:catechol 2,3-dioxygenase-like lactoylglutathione lyase family enzyme
MSTLDRALPPPGLTSFYQVGIVVPDLEAAIAFYTETLKAPPFLVLADVDLDDEIFEGRPFAPRTSLAFSYLGNLQIELCQPLEGGDESVYTQFLDRVPAGGVHHMATRVATIEGALGELGRTRDDIVQSARAGGTRFAYLDIAAPTGLMVEIVELDEGGVGMFEALLRGETVGE